MTLFGTPRVHPPLRSIFSIGHLVSFLFLSVLCKSGLGEDWLRVGDEAYSKDVSKAVQAYRAAKKNEPTNYEATWKLARSIIDQATLMKRGPEQKKLLVEAQTLAREAIRLQPRDSKGCLYLAIAEGKLALLEGGRKKVELGKDVEMQAEKALELNPKEDLAYHVLGIWNREMATLNAFLKKIATLLYGKLPPASLDASVGNFKKAIELHPDAIAHHAELGVTYLAVKKWALARDEFDKALKLPQQYPADGTYQQQARKGLEQVKGKLSR